MDKPHKKLDVWVLAMELGRKTYALTATFPTAERFGLVSQMRRAAVSIPSNIAEGAARDSDNEFRHFLSMARRSLSELDTQLGLSRDLGLHPRTVAIRIGRTAFSDRPHALRVAPEEKRREEGALALSFFPLSRF